MSDAMPIPYNWIPMLRIPIRGYESLFASNFARTLCVTNPYKGL